MSMTFPIRPLLTLLILFISSSLCAQNHLALTKYRNGKNLKVHIGESIKVKKENSSSVVSGQVFSIDSGKFILQIDTLFDTCYVSNILWIKWRRNNAINSFLKGSANSITSAGPVYLLLGATNNTIKDMPPAFREHNIVTAGIITAVGLLWYATYELVSNKKYRKKRWKYRPNNFESLI